MEAGFVISTVFEIALVAFVTYGLFNETKFAETERRVFRYLKRALRALVRGGSLSEVRY